MVAIPIYLLYLKQFWSWHQGNKLVDNGAPYKRLHKDGEFLEIKDNNQKKMRSYIKVKCFFDLKINSFLSFY